MNVVERFSSDSPDRVAIAAPSGSSTYGALHERAARWRGALRAAGVGPGHRVATIIGNNELFPVASLAVMGSGAAVAPLNPEAPPAELARNLAALTPVAVIADRQLEPGPDDDDTDGPRWIRLSVDVLDAGPPSPVVAVEDDDVAALLMTSGTAGWPKPAVLTHGNLDASLRSLDGLGLDLGASTQVMLAVVPLSHVLGFNAILNYGLSIGATIVVEDFTTPARLTELVAGNGVTILSAPPTLWRALADQPDVDPARYRTVTLAISGADKLAPRTWEAVERRLGLRLDEGYGLTETCAVLTTSTASEAPLGSVGPLLPGVEARLVDTEGRDVLVGDPGELWVRGPMVSPGYLDGDAIDPGPGRRPDGWLATGDVAVVDEGGNLTIVDRMKDTVIVSGFNVFPAEIEAVLEAHPDVASAAVVPRPDESTGQALVAHIVPRAGVALDPGALEVHCRGQLARYKVPRHYEIAEALPTGVIGKLRRRDVAARALVNRDRRP